jgi:hypothetical protein
MATRIKVEPLLMEAVKNLDTLHQIGKSKFKKRDRRTISVVKDDKQLKKSYDPRAKINTRDVLALHLHEYT